MTDYPEALVDKVAKAIYERTYASTPYTWEAVTEFTDDDGVEWAEQLRSAATDTLDALGFTPYVGSQYWRSAIHVEDYK